MCFCGVPLLEINLSQFTSAIAFALSRPRTGPGGSQLSLFVWEKALQACISAVKTDGWEPSVLSQSLELMRKCPRGNLELLPSPVASPLLASVVRFAQGGDMPQANVQLVQNAESGRLVDVVGRLVMTGIVKQKGGMTIKDVGIFGASSICLLSDRSLSYEVLQ